MTSTVGNGCVVFKKHTNAVYVAKTQMQSHPRVMLPSMSPNNSSKAILWFNHFILTNHAKGAMENGRSGTCLIKKGIDKTYKGGNSIFHYAFCHIHILKGGLGIIHGDTFLTVEFMMSE